MAQRPILLVVASLVMVFLLVTSPTQAFGGSFSFFSGPTAPVGIATHSGIVYWANYDTGELLSMKVGASSPTVLLSGLTHPSGVAIDQYGNIFFSEDTVSSSDVKELVGGSGTPKLIFTVSKSVSFIAVDSKDNVYFEQGGGCNGQGYNNSIRVYVHQTGKFRTILNGFLTNEPSYGQVYVRSGTLYFTTCTGNVEALKPIQGGTPRVLVSGLGSGSTVSSNGVFVDSRGNVFFTNYWNSVGELPSGSNTPVTIATAGETHYCVTVDVQGRVFYTDNLGGTIWEIPTS